MLKGQDIVVLLSLAGDEPRTVREGAARAGFDIGGVSRALHRLSAAGMYDQSSRQIRVLQAEEFLVHGLKYVFPAHMRGEARGIPTAWAAEPLSRHLAETDEPPPVWAHPDGQVRGIAVDPLHAIAPEAALRSAAIARRLALTDALRMGDARSRSLAKDLLHDELRQPAFA